MKPAAVTESLLHDLVMSSAAEGTGQTAVAAAVTLGERILLCGHDTRDFDREWDLPGGMPLPGETLTSALSRILACDYGLDATEFGAYLDEAATELLIRHRTWLRRNDFTTQFITAQTGPSGTITAFIIWDEAITALQAGNLPCSGGEASILRLAASLASTSPVTLRDVITGLDQANIHLVLNAIRNAGGRN